MLAQKIFEWIALAMTVGSIVLLGFDYGIRAALMGMLAMGAFVLYGAIGLDVRGGNRQDSDEDEGDDKGDDNI